MAKVEKQGKMTNLCLIRMEKSVVCDYEFAL
jgi:hypothetical protein